MQIALLIDCENAKPDSIDGILASSPQKAPSTSDAPTETGRIRRAGKPNYIPSPFNPVDLLYTERVDGFALVTSDTELMNVLRAAIEGMKDENGFAPMTRIGQYLSNHSSLSSKNYGYARWSDLIRATENFEESPGENHQLAFGGKKARSIPAQPAQNVG